MYGLTSVTVVGGDGSMYRNVSATYDTRYPNHMKCVFRWLGVTYKMTYNPNKR